jgi:hypothetical protein
MDIDFSNMPVLFEQEIRDIQADLERLKRSTMNLYEEGKPILIEMETLKRGSSLITSAEFHIGATLPFELPAELGGLGLIIKNESIHRRD